MVAVVTDSAANLPLAMAAEHRIEIVPLYLSFGDRDYRDGVDVTPADFYKRLVADRVRATTSAPSPGDFLDAFVRTEDPEIVCVSVTGAMSASCNNARLAAEQTRARVEVVDSMTASMAQGFVALEAARLAEAGRSLEEVAAAARALAARTTLIATVDTFEFLRRSGRVNALVAYAATMLDIKPVFRLHVGEASGVARPRSRRRALARVVAQSVAEIGGRPARVAAFHAAAAEEAAALLEAIAARTGVVERLVVEVTPVIGAHTGPGLVGAAMAWDEAKLPP